MKNILFVCSANRFRSVIAAEYFRHLLEEKHLDQAFEVGSAGVWAVDGEPPVREAIQFGRTRQLDLEPHRSRETTRQIITVADLIVVMSDGQKESISLEFPEAADRIFLLSDICTGEIYDIPDPILTTDDTPEVVGTEICSLLDTGFEKILQSAATPKELQ